MARFGSLSCFLFITCSYVVFNGVYSETCVKKTPCSCEFANGTGIDLSKSEGKVFYEATNVKDEVNKPKIINSYYFHPCSDIVFTDFGNSVTITDNTCDKYPLAVCNAELKYPNDGKSNITAKYQWAGNTTSVQFEYEDNYNVVITYNNTPSLTKIKLVCALTGKSSLVVNSADDPQNVILEYHSPEACLRVFEDAAGRSVGATLLIIFFTLLLVYLVLGVCTKKFLMGATGVEVLPNITFWLDLPNLVKDGWMFLRNGCKAPPSESGFPTSPDPNSYDSI